MYGTHVADRLAWRTGRRAPLARPYHCFQRDAGGSRTHLNRVAGGCRAVWLQRHVIQCPRQESNLVFDLRRVACKSATLRGHVSFSAPPRNRTPSCRFEVCRAIRHTRRASVSTRNRTWIWTFGGSMRSLHHRDIQCPDLESNQDQGLRRALCDPLHHRDVQPEPTTGFAPA